MMNALAPLPWPAWRQKAHDAALVRAEPLRALAAERLTASEIGKRMGMTRNQVAGLCSRTGIRLLSRPKKKPVKVDLAKEMKVDQACGSDAFKFRGVQFRERGCRWPAWGNEAPTHRYCGKDKSIAGPYCDAHAAVAYKATPAWTGK